MPSEPFRNHFIEHEVEEVVLEPEEARGGRNRGGDGVCNRGRL